MTKYDNCTYVKCNYQEFVSLFANVSKSGNPHLETLKHYELFNIILIELR